MKIAGLDIPEINPASEGEEDLYTLRYLLDYRLPTSLLATVIERRGIDMRDRYGRLVNADETEREKALDAIASVAAWQISRKEVYLEGPDWFSENEDKTTPFKDEKSSQLGHYREVPSPLEWTEGEFSDFDRFGWRDISLLSHWCDTETAMDDQRPNRDYEELTTRNRGSFLRVIAALAEEGKIPLGSWGLAVRLHRHTQKLDSKLGDQAIRDILKEVQEFIS